MGTVLYELHFGNILALSMPLIMTVFLILFPVIAEKMPREKGAEMSPVGRRIFHSCCLGGSLFVGLIAAVILITEISGYSQLADAYNRGEYEIVEGYVENYDTTHPRGGPTESFEINGVYFAYSEYEIHQGYRKDKAHGGVISGNGQYLKIGYVNTYSNGERRNIIVYIEEVQT